MSQQLKAPGEQLPGSAGRPEDTSARPDMSHLTGEAREWVLRAYGERDNLRKEVEMLRNERERFDQELRNRDQLLTTLAATRTSELADQRGMVPREYTEQIQRPESKPLEYDPYGGADAASQLDAEVRRIATEIANQGDRAMSDWYLKDRQQVWNAVTQQDSLVMNYNVEIANLVRNNPNMSIAEVAKLIEAAPRFGYSIGKAYEGVHPEVARERMRSEVRAELEAQIKAPPPAMPPPVLGHPTAIPRRKLENRPKNYIDATRMAYESAGDKLLE